MHGEQMIQSRNPASLELAFSLFYVTNLSKPLAQYTVIMQPERKQNRNEITLQFSCVIPVAKRFSAVESNPTFECRFKQSVSQFDWLVNWAEWRNPASKIWLLNKIENLSSAKLLLKFTEKSRDRYN